MDYLNRLEYEAIAAAVGLDNNIHEGVYQAQAAHRVIVTNRIPDSDLTPKELAYVQAVRARLAQLSAKPAPTPTEPTPEVTVITPEAGILPVVVESPADALKKSLFTRRKKS